MKPFLFALNGLKTAFYSEWNLKFHSISALVVILLGWWLKITSVEWMMLVFCIGLVWVAELLNTAIEYLTNHVSPDFHPVAGKVKDIAAAAVLMAALTSAIIGSVIFIPRIGFLLGLGFR